MVPGSGQNSAVPIPAKRMAAKQQRYDVGNHQKHSVCHSRSDHLLPVLPKQEEGCCIWPFVAVDPAVLCVLYSGCRRRRTGADPWDADVAEDRVLYTDGSGVFTAAKGRLT